MTPDLPLQPIITDEHGTKRFLRNSIICALVNRMPEGLNTVARELVREGLGTREEYDQLLQLIGHSVSGAPLSDATRARVDAVEDGLPVNYTEGFKDGYSRAVEDMRERLEELKP